MDASPRRRFPAWAGVPLAVAAAVRAARLVEAHATDPAWARPMMDAAFYDEMADRILRGADAGPYLMAPFYGWFLAGLRLALGRDPAAVYAVQAALGLSLIHI